MDKELLDNLCTAVSNGRTDVVRTLLSMCEKGLHPDKSNGTCLITTNDLLTKQCYVTGTLLHLATELDHVDIVRTLLSSGAHANLENSAGESAFDLIQTEMMAAVYVDELLKCAAKSEINRIRELIDAGVDVNSKDSPESKNTALHWAVCFGKPEAVHCLLDLGAAVNVTNGHGATPLHEGVKRKNLEIIRLLLSAGADPIFKSTFGKYLDKTPMDIANGNEEIINLCLEYVSKDTESEKSNEDSLADQSSKSNSENLSESLQSLSVVTVPTVKKIYVHQSRITVPPDLLTPLPLITDSKLHLLWPQPQKMVQTDAGSFKMLPKNSVQIIHNEADVSALSLINVWEVHSEKLKSLGNECNVENIVHTNSDYTGNIICHLNSHVFPRREGYKLVVANNQIRILISDVMGLHYALYTLEQLFSLYSEVGTLPAMYIYDWPQLQHRAVLLDFSYGARKPTLETLKEYIRTMSSLKFNQLHCYFRYEHNNGNNLPFSNKDFIELTRFCSEHFVNLIPAIDVNASERNISVTESITKPAHQLMSLFSSKSIQIGPNLSKIVLQEILSSKNSKIIWNMLLLPTSTTVYLCYSNSIPGIDWLHFLPLNCILLDYGYMVEHDYDHPAKVITYLGHNVCIGTGTTAWGCIGGSPENSVLSIHRASIAASAYGSFGMIVADWQTVPHHPPFCFSWPGILLSLGMSWNSNVHKDYLRARIPELLNLYVYQDTAQVTGLLSVELGRVEAYMHQAIYQKHKNSGKNIPPSKISILHQLLVDADAVLLDNFTFDLLQEVIRTIKKYELQLQKAKPSCFQHGEIILELRLTMDLLLFIFRLSKVMVSTGLNPSGNSCGLPVINVGISNLPPIARTDLANKLLALIEQFKAVWLSRNLPCGLNTSVAMFMSLLAKLIPESDQSLYSVDKTSPLLKELYASKVAT